MAAPEAPSPPPLFGNDASSSTSLSWREQKAIQDALDESKKVYRDGIVDFPPSAWKQKLYVSRLESSDGAPSGAVRVSIPSVKATVVLKGSSTVAQDWLGQKIVKRVLGEGSVPASRLLEYEGSEWGVAKQGVLKALPRASGLDRPVLTLMSFIDGASLVDLAGGVYSPCLLRQIGALCAIDGCVGNFDRLPVGDVFDNDGNCSNALINHKGQLVAIDTAVGLPVKPSAYVNRLRAWLALKPPQKWARTIGALEALSGPAPEWVADALETGSALAIPALTTVLSAESVEKMFAELAGEVKTDWGDVWRDSVTACRKPSLLAVGHALSEYGPSGPMVPPYVGPLVLTLERTPKGLEAAVASVGVRPDVVVLPECWSPPDCQKSIKLHEAEVARVARKFGAYIVGGTYLDAEERVVMPFFDPSGAIVARYEKRTLAKKLGTLPGIFQTALGRISLLICNDVEISVYVDEASAAGAWLILNPCFVGKGDTLELLERRLIGQAITRQLAFARADIGPGTAMCVCAGYTFMGAGLCRLEATRREWVGVPEPSRHRSTPEDNSGNRYVVRRRRVGDEEKHALLCAANPDIPEVELHCFKGLSLLDHVVTFTQHNVPASLEDIRAGTVKI